jgi:hypothetical protein
MLERKKMKYIISLEGHESDPLDTAQVVLLCQSGVLKRNSRVREDKQGAEWSTAEELFPFLSGVRTWSELTTRLVDRAGMPASICIKSVQIGFWNLVGLIFKFSLAAIPAAILLWVLFIFLGGVLAGFLSALH